MSNNGGDNGTVFDHVTYTLTALAGGATNDRKPVREIKLKHYTIVITQTRTQHNNCGLQCVIGLTGSQVSPIQMRRACGLAPNTLLTMPELLAVYKRYAPDDGKPLVIHTDNTEEIDMELGNNVFYNKHHYSIITDATLIPKDPERKVKRGQLFWDIETRVIDAENAYSVLRKDVGKPRVEQQRLHHMGDAITHMCYTDYKATEQRAHSFETSSDKTSLRQFIDWLVAQSRAGKHYYAYAHNGGNFDVYFMMAAFTPEEKLQYKPTMRGSTIIKLEFCGHIFIDTMCFMATSLERLSNNYQVKTPKLTEFVVAGTPLTSLQMCFYRPELTLLQFMLLKRTKPEFWAAYNEYCAVDCVALSQVWAAFEANVERLLERFVARAPMFKHELMAKCSLRQSCTIGGHALKILNVLNGTANPKKMINAYEQYARFLEGDQEKHDFVMRNFKRGGISHCNQMGKHVGGIASVDVTSQYPAAMMGMRIPSGYSRWVTEYVEEAHGFYELEDLVFDTDLSFKPVATVTESGVLNWNSGKTIPKLHADSYMVKYLKANFGLKSFRVVRGLVGKRDIKGSELFGNYVDVLFAEKAKEDELKEAGSPDANASYRDTIKLYLNSVTGKMNADPSKYEDLKQLTAADLADGVPTKDINGVRYKLGGSRDNTNPWIVAGVMIYSYSKRQLFEYAHCLPDDSASVIHVETDSIYFNRSLLPAFKENLARYEGEYGCEFGSVLGSVKVEMDTDQPAYFLNKKFYTVHDGSKHVCGQVCGQGYPSPDHHRRRYQGEASGPEHLRAGICPPARRPSHHSAVCIDGAAPSGGGEREGSPADPHD